MAKGILSTSHAENQGKSKGKGSPYNRLLRPRGSVEL